MQLETEATNYLKTFVFLRAAEFIICVLRVWKVQICFRLKNWKKSVNKSAVRQHKSARNIFAVKGKGQSTRDQMHNDLISKWWLLTPKRLLFFKTKAYQANLAAVNKKSSMPGGKQYGPHCFLSLQSYEEGKIWQAFLIQPVQLNLPWLYNQKWKFLSCKTRNIMADISEYFSRLHQDLQK